MFNLPQASSVYTGAIKRLLETKLPAISGEPTYHTIKAIEEKLVSALGGIHTEQGGGNMGFIGLLFSDAEYQTLEDPQGNNPPIFVSAVHPGALVVPAGANIHARADLNAAHARQIQEFHLETAVSTTTAKMIVEAVGEENVVELKLKGTGYSHLDPYTLMTHLYDKYGQKIDEMLTEAHEKMQEPFDITGSSINGLKLRQDKLQDFLRGTAQQCSNGMYVRYTVNVMEGEHFMDKAILKFRRKDEQDKGKDDMWAFMKAEHKKVRTKLRQNAPEANSAILEELRQLKSEMATMKEKNNQVIDQVNTHSDKLSDVQDEIRTKSSVPSIVATDNSANSSIVTKTTREIELEKMVASLKNQCNQLKTNRDNDGGRGRGGRGRG